jgi:hypothetical protein
MRRIALLFAATVTVLGGCISHDKDAAELAAIRNSPEFTEKLRRVYAMVDARPLPAGQVHLGFRELLSGDLILTVEIRTGRQEQFSQDALEEYRLACVEVAARLADALAEEIEPPVPSDIRVQQLVHFVEFGPTTFSCVGEIPIHFRREA